MGTSSSEPTGAPEVRSENEQLEERLRDAIEGVERGIKRTEYYLKEMKIVAAEITSKLPLAYRKRLELSPRSPAPSGGDSTV